MANDPNRTFSIADDQTCKTCLYFVHFGMSCLQVLLQISPQHSNVIEDLPILLDFFLALADVLVRFSSTVEDGLQIT